MHKKYADAPAALDSRLLSVLGGPLPARYRLRRALREGAEGLCLAAEDALRPGRMVALKVVASDRARAMLVELERLRTQAHPHLGLPEGIVGVGRGKAVVVTPYYAGGDLETWAEVAPSLGERVRVAADVLRGLRFLHDRGVLHRDVKPSNIVLDDTGAARLIDFGLAQRADASAAPDLAGTPAYWAPELLGGRPATAASDLFAFGVLLHWLLTGSRPPRLLAAKASSGRPELAAVMELDLGRAHGDRLARLVEDLLHPDPALRLGSAAEALHGLRAALPPSVRPDGETLASGEARARLPGFHGRSALEAELRQLLHDVHTGAEPSLPVWWMEGAPGAGRTAALEAARQMALLRGFEAPEIHLPAAGADLAAWLGLAVPPAERNEPGAVASALLAAASERPWWVGIDDVARCPEPVLAMVGRLARARALHPSARIGLAVVGLERVGQSMALGAVREELSLFARVRSVELEPLDLEAVRQVLDAVGDGQPCPDPLAREVHLATGGAAGHVQQVVRAMLQLERVPLLGAPAFPARLPAAALAAASSWADDARRTITSWPTELRHLAAVLAVVGTALDVADVVDLFEGGLGLGAGMAADTLRRLVSLRGAAVMEGPRGPQVAIATLALVDAFAGLDGLPPGDAETCARHLARFDERYAGAVARLWTRAGDAAEALRWAMRAGQYREAVGAAEAWLGEHRVDEASSALLEDMALAFARAGFPARSRELARALRGQAVGDGGALAEARLGVRLGELELEAGRAREALDALTGLERLEATPGEGEVVAWGWALSARALLTLGQSEDALHAAVGAKAAPAASAGTRFHAATTHALAHLYLGHYDEALAELHVLGEEAAAAERAKEQPFLFNALGLAHQRRGELELARRAYQDSLAAAEVQHNLPRVGIAQMNLGTVAQERGELSRAWWHYEQAEAVARRAADDTALVKALMNQANLAVQAGAVALARRKLELGLPLAVRLRNFFVSAYLEVLLGEAQLRSDNLDAALMAVGQAEEHFRGLGAVREAAECALLEARILLRARRFDRLVAVLDGLDASGSRLGSARLVVWAGHLRVEFERARLGGDAAAAAAALAAALREAGDDVRLEDRWRPHLSLAWVAMAAGKREEAHDHADLCRRLLGRLADRLEEPLRSAFSELPEHRTSRVEADVLASLGPGAGAPAAGFLERVLDLNKRLAAEQDPRRLLEAILDVAVATTGAERGFVLTPAHDRPGVEALDVEVARNFDRSSLRRKELKYSAGIARDVFATGAPLLSVDAVGDERLSSLVSVHAMKLRSVLAVPMRHQGAPIGVIYVDNRFQAGAFTESHLAFMEAFADQAAVALAWTRALVREREFRQSLEVANAELVASRQHIEELNVQLAAELAERTALLEATREQLAAREPLSGEQGWAGIIGASEPMKRVFHLVRRVKDTAVPVLITGESGTGKELVARALHDEGRRAAERFVSINCGAVPETLLEAELFGAVRGAYTGADRDRSGLFEEAHRGTLFLDELGEMSLAMQVKLLRVLESGEVRRVGANETRRVDVRVVAATNRDLQQRVKEGFFREDLYFRLNVVEICLPPLRERSDDIPLLVDTFLGAIADRHGLVRKRLSPAAMRAVKQHRWPGNVRELQAALTSALLLSETDVLTPEDLALGELTGAMSTAEHGYGWDGESALEVIERQVIVDALARLGGNKSLTAKSLGIDRNTLYAKLERYARSERKAAAR